MCLSSDWNRSSPDHHIHTMYHSKVPLLHSSAYPSSLSSTKPSRTLVAPSRADICRAIISLSDTTQTINRDFRPFPYHSRIRSPHRHPDIHNTTRSVLQSRYNYRDQARQQCYPGKSRKSCRWCNRARCDMRLAMQSRYRVRLCGILFSKLRIVIIIQTDLLEH